VGISTSVNSLKWITELCSLQLAKLTKYFEAFEGK